MGRDAAASPWEDLEAPSLSDIEMLAVAAFGRLPEEFRALAGEIVIRVAEFPEDDVLDEMKLESPYDLLGLFQGVGIAHAGSASDTGQFPNMIWLYRRPILDYWAEYHESLGHLVTHVLVHEIGHHFGLSDDDMEGIEESAGV